MSGALSSLGLGSGVLTQSVIDQLKAADTSARINPITKNIQDNTTKQADLAQLFTLLSNVQSSASDLGTEGMYLKRTATSSSTAIGITAADGVNIENDTMNVSQIAKNDVLQSSGYSSQDSVVNLGSNGNMSIHIGTNATYNVSVTSGMTLTQLAQSINDNTGGNVVASVINTGVGTNPYSLIVKSANTGSTNAISLSTNFTSSLGLDTPKITSPGTATTSATTLASGDITINGVAIAGMTLANGNSETNAQTMMTYINLQTAATGVTAYTDGNGKLSLMSDGRGIGLSLSAAGQAATGFTSSGAVSNSESYSGTSAATTTNGTVINSGDIKINGTSIAGVTLSSTNAETNAQAIIAQINLQKSTTGVTAMTDGAGKILLYAQNGGPVSLTLANGAAAATGLAATDSTVNGTQYSKLQAAQDAKFTFNGISMQRSSNSVTDLVSGATFNLLGPTTSSTGSSMDATISITQDTSGIQTAANSFVTAYNSLMSQISQLTSYDSTTGTASPFTGVSEITSIQSTLSGLLTATGPTGGSLMDYGFSLDKTGQLSLDSSMFSSKLSSNPSALESLFFGNNKITTASYTANFSAAGSDNTSNTLSSDKYLPSAFMSINGVALPSVTMLASNTSEQNAQLLVTAINNLYSQTSVKAYTDGKGKLKLENSTGGSINLTTTSDGSLYSGLSASTTSNNATFTNATLAYGSTQTQNGLFAQMYSSLQTMYSNSNSTLNTYNTSLTDEMTNLTAEKTSAQDLINSKYTMMTSQFQLYDSIIAKYQQSFASLQQQIKSASSGG